MSYICSEPIPKENYILGHWVLEPQHDFSGDTIQPITADFFLTIQVSVYVLPPQRGLP